MQSELEMQQALQRNATLRTLELEGESFTRVTVGALFLLLLATVIGVGIALLSSFLFRRVPSLREQPTRQCALVVLGGYLAYGAAEACGISGVTALFFCAVTMGHYAWHSLSLAARDGTVLVFQTSAAIAV